MPAIMHTFVTANW